MGGWGGNALPQGPDFPKESMQGEGFGREAWIKTRQEQSRLAKTIMSQQFM